MESLDEVRREIARLCRMDLPARLTGLSEVAQEAMFTRRAEAVMTAADEIAPEIRAAALAEETARLGHHSGGCVKSSV